MKRPRENDGESWGFSNRDDAGCSDTKRDDYISEDILDMLDHEADPSPDDGDNVSDPVLEPKHEIFLSHSGKQKDFTELLCRELERWGYSPFFDVRPDSLPKGKKFPELIFRAARQCRVAVLILSEEFFTNTKWPMLELAAFVDAQERNAKQNLPAVDILPVYLGLTREECRKDENVERWQRRWEEMERSERAEKMKEMDEVGRAELQSKSEAARERGETRSWKWKDALKVLGPSNGIEYDPSSRQAGLIDRVVSAVRGLLPPPSMASDPSTQAKGRICKTLIEMISKTRVSAKGARVVGIYGVGGMGKTTFCKELCCVLYKRFEGKVCHAELGRVSQSKLQKEVVQKLTNVNKSSLSCADDSKIMEHLRSRMVGEKVFLALDNVWPESKEEAKVYVEQAQYGKGSIVVVTARSMDILLSLKIMRGDCFAMPELEEEDARRLFIHHAAPEFHSQSKDDDECIQGCVYACHFSKGGNGGWHFLPLALKVLGQQMRGMEENPKKWVESLAKGNKFDQDRKKEHEIFVILDMAFLNCCTFFEWLSIVYYGTLSKESLIKDRLQGLKARALLEDIGDGSHRVHAHDLYFEFAKFEASRGGMDERRVVWHEDITDLPTDLVKTPSGTCWSNVERVGVSFYWEVERDLRRVEGVKWQHFANVVMLVLEIGGDPVLDLRGLQCLRVLSIKGYRSTVIGLGELRSLRWLDLEGIHCIFLGEIGGLRELEMLRVWTNCSVDRSDCSHGVSPPSGLPNLHKCINLRGLVVECGCLGAWLDLGGMTFLRGVDLALDNATEGPAGLGSQLSALQQLRLSSRYTLRNCLPQLHEVVSLQELKVWNFPEVEVFPDIHMLTRLRILVLYKLPKLVRLPELGELVALERLELENLPKLVQLPELGGLVALESLVLQRLSKLRELPNMRSLSNLQLISLRHVEEVWERPRLLDMVPSQLRYFNLVSSHCGWLEVEERSWGNRALDLHEWYKLPSATVMTEIDPGFPGWCVPRMM